MNRPLKLSLLASFVLAVLLLASQAASAGMFDDDEARKAIVDLRTRVNQLEEQARTRDDEHAKANAALMEQVSALRRSLLDLNNQLEAARGDIAKLVGSNEELTRNVAELQKREKDSSQVLDDRLRKLEPVKVSIDGREFVAEPEERKAYEDAIATIRGGDFDKAVSQLNDFQRHYPASGYADSVRFWLGNALYGKRDYKGAVAAFKGFVAAAPEHPRAPEALLALANSQAEMKDTRSAKRTLESLIKTYPQSEAAQAGKQRLVGMK
jgi:tol-pal system protein YbgF